MNARGGVASISPLGLQTETVTDAMSRADSVSGDKWYSGVMLHSKDLRRVVLMVAEYRALTSELAAERAGKLILGDALNKAAEELVSAKDLLIQQREEAGLQVAVLQVELTAAKEEIERLKSRSQRWKQSSRRHFMKMMKAKGEVEEMRQHCIHCIDDPDEDLCSTVAMLEAAESSLASERKETERLRGIIEKEAVRLENVNEPGFACSLREATLHQPKQESCVWKRLDQGQIKWESECGHVWGDTSPDGIVCGHCGKPVQIHPPQQEEQ